MQGAKEVDRAKMRPLATNAKKLPGENVKT
jgi:hypothetical protein